MRAVSTLERFSRPSGTSTTLLHIGPSDKSLGYYQSVPPGRGATALHKTRLQDREVIFIVCVRVAGAESSMPQCRADRRRDTTNACEVVHISALEPSRPTHGARWLRTPQ